MGEENCPFIRSEVFIALVSGQVSHEKLLRSDDFPAVADIKSLRHL